MRQAGVIAAPMIVALEEMMGRLEEDHRRAHTIAEGKYVQTLVGLSILLFCSLCIHFRN